MADHCGTYSTARPIAAGPVLIRWKRPTIGLRTSQDVVIIWRITPSGNHGATLGQRSLHVQFIVVAMEIVEAFRDDFALEILPRAAPDPIPSVDGGCTVYSLDAEISPPGLAPCPCRLC